MKMLWNLSEGTPSCVSMLACFVTFLEGPFQRPESCKKKIYCFEETCSLSYNVCICRKNKLLNINKHQNINAMIIKI